MDEMTRREAIALTAAAAGAALLAPGLALAEPEDAVAEMMKFTGGAKPADGRVRLDLPEVAENGNTVRMAIKVESPMTADDHVKRVLVVAERNPLPVVAVFKFTPHNGSAEISTRMRLARTQNVTAIAEMSDGSFFSATRQVTVTIGGCGA